MQLEGLQINGVETNLFRKQTIFYCTLMLKFLRTGKSSTPFLHKEVVVKAVIYPRRKTGC